MKIFWNIITTICSLFIVMQISFAILHEGGIQTPFDFTNNIFITVCEIIYIALLWFGAEIFKYFGDAYMNERR